MKSIFLLALGINFSLAHNASAQSFDGWIKVTSASCSGNVLVLASPEFWPSNVVPSELKLAHRLLTMGCTEKLLVELKAEAATTFGYLPVQGMSNSEIRTLPTCSYCSDPDFYHHRRWYYENLSVRIQYSGASGGEILMRSSARKRLPE